jgi:hypothetical protein
VFFARLTGQHHGASYSLSAWLFRRAVALVYLIAFGSLAVQWRGLWGRTGILPAGEFLARVKELLGLERFWQVPTVFWLDAGDAALGIAIGLGIGLSVLVLLDRIPAIGFAGLWILYLSFVSIGQDFLAFQWDALLLEAGLLAIVVTGGRRRGARRAPEPAPLEVALLWWLPIRLLVESGVVKLTSGDPTWKSLTALDFHFFTQPIPPWTAWYAQQAPEIGKHASVLIMLGLEIVTPLLAFTGGIGRRVAFAGVVALQTGIAATGNFAFFNLLTVGLALPLLDDSAWRRLLPARLAAALIRGEQVAPGLGSRMRGAVEVGLLAAATVSFIATVLPGGARPAPLGWIDPFRSVNSYGLFRVMTTERPEIAVEGSADGERWIEYRFKDKPGDSLAAPRFVAPHQPRLDWQMWFAALGRFETELWFQAFLRRLLEGSPAVTGLLASNPFPDRPPRFVRARLYDYRFTTAEQRRRTGAWWTRRLIGEYAPEVALK